MDQLTGLDNSFLLMETGAALGHVGSYATFDASDLAQGEFYAAFRKTLEERLHLLPPYRRKLAEVPLGLDRPYWVEDEDFDLDFHVRHIAVPPPGDREQQAALVARLHSRPLDRARPLWEVYVIEGLADGQGGVLLEGPPRHDRRGLGLADDGEAPRPRSERGDVVEPPKTPWVADTTPSQGEMLMRGAAGAATHPGRMARTLYRTARGVWESNELLASAARGLGLDRLPLTRSILRRRGAEIDADRIPQAPAPRAPWNLSITPHRRVACFSQPLADYKHVKKAFGTTLNDVVMAVTGGALRRYLESHSSLPEAPLKAMVPVSVRSESEAEVYSKPGGQRGLRARDRTRRTRSRRLMRIHRAMQAAKRMHAATPATLLQDWTEFAMPALLGQAQRIAARTKILDRLNPPFNVIISNVPGPREPLYLAGAEMKDYFPVSAITDGQGLNVTVISYLDHLDFGLIACRELVPDLQDLESAFDESLAELVRLADAAES